MSTDSAQKHSSRKGTRTAGQIKRIWASAIAAGVAYRGAGGTDDANLYLMIHSLTGREKMSDLSYNEAKTVIEELQKQVAKKQREKHRARNVTALQTPDQREKISHLLTKIEDIGVADPAAYASGMIGGKDIYRLTLKESQRLIDVMKAVIARGKRK